MRFQAINRGDPEKVFITVKNTYSTAAITVGQPVVFDYVTDADGVGVTQGVTATLPLSAGIVETASIAVDDYGLVQVYGHNANALVDGTTGVSVGKPLKIKTGTFTLDVAGTTATGAASIFVAGQAYTTGAAAAKKVFIRAL